MDIAKTAAAAPTVRSLLETLSDDDLRKWVASLPSEIVLRDAGNVTREVDAVTELGIVEKSINIAARSATFIASTAAIDSYDEVVEQVWDFTRYERNPIVLYNHQRFGSELPIGIASAYMNGDHLECTITFASAEANPLAERVWKLVQEKVLRAVSVGFRPRTVRRELRDDREIYVLSNNLLYEISVTPIGANPDALAKAKAAARAKALADHKPAPVEIDGAALRRVVEEIHNPSLRSDGGPAPNAPKGAPVQENHIMDIAQLQKIADERLAEITTLKNAAQTHDGVVNAERAKVTALIAEKTALEAKVVVLDGAVSGVLTSLKLAGVVLDEKAAPAEQVVKAVTGLVAERADLTSKNIAAEVDKLVGVKISEAERADFIELRTSNPKLYERMVAGRSANGVLAGTAEDKTKADGTAAARAVMGADPKPESALPVVSDKGAGLAALLEKELDGAPGDHQSMGDLLNG